MDSNAKTTTVRGRLPLLIVGGLIVVIGGIITATLIFTPDQTNPAFATAIRFVEAAAAGDDATAFALLDEPLQAAVLESCPDGQVSACVHNYTPPEWGPMLSVVFRRAAPDGDNWNVDLIATYAEDVGFSGVCIYTRVEPADDATWRVAGYAGFVHCGDPASRNMATNPDAPNRLP